MKNPYGLHKGALVSAESVKRGLACDCTCPACGHPLQSHQGEKTRAYFSHYRGSDCGAGYETALHLLAKEVLGKHKQLLLPELRATSDMSVAVVGTFAETEYVVRPWTRISFDGVELEKRVDAYIPDLVMYVGDRKLLVEIRVTHAVDERERDWAILNQLPMVEFDFSRMPRSVDEQELTSALIDTYKRRGMGRGGWVHHPRLAETTARLTSLYLEKQTHGHSSGQTAHSLPPTLRQQSFDFNGL